MATLYLLIERAKRDTPFPKCANFALFSTCHTQPFAPTLHQVRNEPKQTNKHKPMKTNLLPLGFLSLITVDALMLSQLPLALPEALCFLFLFLWSTVLLWRSLLS